jgi:isoquinoline 1-oxidoreductase
MNPRVEIEIEVERYELNEAAHYRFEIERREFMRIFGVMGAGVLVFASVPGSAQESGRTGQRSASTDVSAWVHIDERGQITGYTGKTEIGQNIRTSLAQAIADELRVPLDRVSLVMADTDLVPFDQGTFGSQSTPRMAPQLARAAAAAREMLLDRAATEWNVDRTTLGVKDGKIVGQRHSAGLGEIAKGQKLVGAVPASVAPSPVAQWASRGTAEKKVAGADFVTGRHRFTPDITRPGMLYGAIIRPAGYTGTLTSMDDSAARAIKGVTVVRDGTFAGVVAPTERTARRGAAAVKADWRVPTDLPSSQTVYEHLKNTCTSSSRSSRKATTTGCSPSSRRSSSW